MTAAAQLPRPGDMIAGKYVLDRLLGQGGMGAVFAARHLKLSKAVAIKIMLADASNPEASQRFINEGRAAANIQNEHVVRVDDVDEEMGYAYMVLELLEGEDLAQVLERDPARRIQPHVAVNYVLQGLKGVMQAHAIGIVHRDLKPSNLFLAKRKDGSVVVKVLDFGISKAQGSSALAASPNALTSTKAMLGSPLYMSPEQLRNAKGVDHRADIWAMGVILYELITGQLPFMGENLGELFAAILETDPQPLSARVPGVPHGLDDVVLRCLQRKPDQRYQTVAELAQALAPFERQLPPSPMAHKGGATAFMPGQTAPHAGMQTGAQAPAILTQSQNSQVSQISQVHSAVQAVPVTGPHLPHGAITPSTPGGVQMPPGFNQTTGSGWQTQGGTNGLPKSRLPLILGGVFAAALAAGVLLILFVLKGKPHDSGLGKTDPPPVVSVAVTTDLPKTGDVPPPPPPQHGGHDAPQTPPIESASATPPPSAIPSAVVAVPKNPVVTHPVTQPPVVKPPPPPPPPPAPAAPAPTPAPKPNSGKTTPGVENTR